jgi:orotidine-5'-phosphate decarboxylase
VKPNLAFYESMGAAGIMSLEMTINYLREKHPDLLIIADAKRGDIGNTSRMYAHTFFKTLGCDAVTLSPFMGRDSIAPFLETEGKWAILLALTSNEGAADFQQLQLAGGRRLFEQVITTTASWGTVHNIMYVVGATRASLLTEIRSLIPDHFLLVPGVGSQGGSLEEVAEFGMNDRCGLLVNASRSILYADVTNRFEKGAREEAARLQLQMEHSLKKKQLI